MLTPNEQQGAPNGHKARRGQNRMTSAGDMRKRRRITLTTRGKEKEDRRDLEGTRDRKTPSMKEGDIKEINVMHNTFL